MKRKLFIYLPVILLSLTLVACDFKESTDVVIKNELEHMEIDIDAPYPKWQEVKYTYTYNSRKEIINTKKEVLSDIDEDTIFTIKDYKSNFFAPDVDIAVFDDEVLYVLDRKIIGGKIKFTEVYNIEKEKHFTPERNTNNLLNGESFPEKEEDFLFKISNHSIDEIREILALTNQTQKRERITEIVSASHWSLLSNLQSYFHQLGSENTNNRKYLDSTGALEAVYMDNGQIVTNPLVEATYNYGISTSEHYIRDVYPYLVWGNQINDNSTILERFIWDYDSGLIFGNRGREYRGKNLLDYVISIRPTFVEDLQVKMNRPLTIPTTFVTV